MSRKVVVTPGVRSGAPCLEGSRVSCDDLMRRIAARGIKDAQQSWHFDDESILNAAHYCASRQCVQDNAFCYGCTLYQPDEDGESNEPYDGWRLAQEILKRNLHIDEKGLPEESWVQSRPRRIPSWEK